MIFRQGARVRPARAACSHDVWEYGARGDGVTDDGRAIQRAITAAAAGDSVYFPTSPFFYRVTEQLQVGSPIVCRGQGSQIRQMAGDTPLFAVSAGGARFSGLHLVGPGFQTSRIHSKAIEVLGPSATNPLRGLVITHCTFSNWGAQAVFAQHVHDLRIENNQIEGCYYAGILLLSCIGGSIRNNDIRNVVGKPNAYGIALTRVEAGSLATDPRSARLTVAGNVVQDVLHWDGINTHGGERLLIMGNVIQGCNVGVGVGPCNDDRGEATFAPRDICVVGNTVVNGAHRAPGTASHGIVFAGADGGFGRTHEWATGMIVGNVVRGHGDMTAKLGAGILCRSTAYVAVSGNTLERCSPNGMVVWYDNREIAVLENVVIDPWAGTDSHSIGFLICGGTNSGTLSGNRLRRHLGPAGSQSDVGSAFAALQVPGWSTVWDHRLHGSTLWAPPLGVAGADASSPAFYCGTVNPSLRVAAPRGAKYFLTGRGTVLAEFSKQAFDGSALGWQKL